MNIRQNPWKCSYIFFLSWCWSSTSLIAKRLLQFLNFLTIPWSHTYKSPPRNRPVLGRKLPQKQSQCFRIYLLVSSQSGWTITQDGTNFFAVRDSEPVLPGRVGRRRQPSWANYQKEKRRKHFCSVCQFISRRINFLSEFLKPKNFKCIWLTTYSSIGYNP